MRAEPKQKKVTRIPRGRNSNIPSLARKSERKARKLDAQVIRRWDGADNSNRSSWLHCEVRKMPE